MYRNFLYACQQPPLLRCCPPHSFHSIIASAIQFSHQEVTASSSDPKFYVLTCTCWHIFNIQEIVNLMNQPRQMILTLETMMGWRLQRGWNCSLAKLRKQKEKAFDFLEALQMTNCISSPLICSGEMTINPDTTLAVINVRKKYGT